MMEIEGAAGTSPSADGSDSSSSSSSSASSLATLQKQILLQHVEEPFDDQPLLTLEHSSKSWDKLVAQVQKLETREALKNPPKFKRISRSCKVMSKEAWAKANKEQMKLFGVGKGKGRAREEEEDKCKCAESGSRCTEGCLNKHLLVECTPSNCSYGADESKQCENRAIQRRQNRATDALPTPGKG